LHWDKAAACATKILGMLKQTVKHSAKWDDSYLAGKRTFLQILGNPLKTLVIFDLDTIYYYSLRKRSAN